MRQADKKKRYAFPIALFPSRVPNRKLGKVMATDDLSNPLPAGAAAGINLTTGEAYIPAGDTAYNRTVRVHESLHAIYSPKKMMLGLVDQALEDMRLHRTCARLEGQPRRDELTVACYDLRTLGKMWDESQRKVALVMLGRALAIVMGGEVRPKQLEAFVQRAFQSPALASTIAAHGGHVAVFKRIVKTLDIFATKGLAGWEQARKTLKPLFDDPQPQQAGQPQPQPTSKPEPSKPEPADTEDEDKPDADKPEDGKPEDGDNGDEDGKQAMGSGEDSEGEGDDGNGDSGGGEDDSDSEDSDDVGTEGGDGVGGGECEPDGIPEPDVDAPTFQPKGGKKPEPPKPENQPTISNRDLDKLVKVEPKKWGVDIDAASVEAMSKATRQRIQDWTKQKENRYGKNNAPEMQIINLHQAFSKKTTEGRGGVPSMMGSKINPSQLVQAAISPVPVKVMKTPVKREMGGTLLIDASGSMTITDDLLRRVIEMAPLATVAYFSGSGRGRGCLVIYADKGKIYNGPKVREDYHGGMPYRNYGNDVDYPAIQWLLKQQAPRAFVGDLMACGPAQVFNDAAVEITLTAEKKGMLKRYASVAEYLEYLEKEHHLKLGK